MPGSIVRSASFLARPISKADRLTSDPAGEAAEIGAQDAFELEMELRGALDWYLVVLAGTEHADIETSKAALKTALDTLIETLCVAHWADHNDQHDDYHDIPDDQWAEIVAGCARAKIDVRARVSEARTAYRDLETRQARWIQSLRAQIARLDLKIATPGYE